MSATVWYDNPEEAAVVTPVQFVNASGANTDPSTITCVVTSPLGAATTYTYPTGITRSGTGAYGLQITGLVDSGLWTFVWIGYGNGVNQVMPGTFRLVPLKQVGMGMQYWYVGKEELKSRLSIAESDTASDYEIALAIQCVTNWINTYCGEHFYQIAETRTYMPTNVVELNIDSLVSTPGIVSATQVNLDYTGNGVYNTSWTYNQQYCLKLGTPELNGGDNWNINSAGVPRPYQQLQVLTGTASGAGSNGQWLPYVWPFTNLNRVQIIGTWGWNFIPPNVQMAAMMLAVDMFKSKDAPWGVAGVGDLGIVKVQSNPWVVELLRPYINMRKKVGV